MYRTLTLAAVLAAMALPAAAETTVTINVAGLAAPAARAAILKAAQTACRIEMNTGSTFDQYYLGALCIRAAVQGAETDLEKVKVSAVNPARLASR